MSELSPKGKLVTLVGFDPNGNIIPLQVSADGFIKANYEGALAEVGDMLIPKGNLVTPVGFDPDGNILPIQVTADGYLRIVIDNLPSGGDFQLIQDITLSAEGASFDFTNIPQSFKHLKLISYLRDKGSTSIASVRFNNDSSAVYSSLISYFRAVATLGTVEVINGTKGDIMSSAFDAGDIANIFRITETIIPDYTNTSNFKSWVGPAHAPYVGTASNVYIYFFGGHWKSTAAISRLTITEKAGANFMAGSRISLYGLK